MRLIVNINIKKIFINRVYEYIHLNYKGYKHGGRFWFYIKIFSIWFKNEEHGYGLERYTPHIQFCYKNRCIYREYGKFIYSCGKEYYLKN